MGSGRQNAPRPARQGDGWAKAEGAQAKRASKQNRKFSRAAPRDRPGRRAYMAALSACHFNPPAQRLPTTASRRWQASQGRPPIRGTEPGCRGEYRTPWCSSSVARAADGVLVVKLCCDSGNEPCRVSEIIRDKCYLTMPWHERVHEAEKPRDSQGGKNG